MTGREGDQFDQLRALIDDYWCLAWAEGNEGRKHDTEAGDAQRVSSQIDRAIDTLRVQLESAEQRAQTSAENAVLILGRAEAAEAESKRLTKANIAYSQRVAELVGRAGVAEAEVARLSEPEELRKVAKRNLRSLIEQGSADRALMLKCLEELS